MQNWKLIFTEEFKKNKNIDCIKFVNKYEDLIDSITRDAKLKKVKRFKASLEASPTLIVSNNGSTKNQSETVETDFEKGVTKSDKVICIERQRLNDPDALLRAHDLDPNKFDLVSAKNSKWDQVSNKDGHQVLYSSKITAKPKSPIFADSEYLLKYFETYTPNIKRNWRPLFEGSSEYLVLPLYDFHWGRLPYIDNVENFSLDDAKSYLIDNMVEYVDRFEGRHFKEVFIVIGQDFFNSCYNGMTSSQSHIQDNIVDTRTMYRTGTELIEDIVELFASRGDRVSIIGSIGNHSTSEEEWLFMLLKAYYRNDDRIRVDDSSHPRKYLSLGEACVGLGHVDKERDRIFGLMQCEVPEMWSMTSQHLFIAGHLHHFSVESKNGVELWRVPSPTLPDIWTVRNGYVMNPPKTMAFIFDEEKGLTENHFVYI